METSNVKIIKFSSYTKFEQWRHKNNIKYENNMSIIGYNRLILIAKVGDKESVYCILERFDGLRYTVRINNYTIKRLIYGQIVNVSISEKHEVNNSYYTSYDNYEIYTHKDFEYTPSYKSIITYCIKCNIGDFNKESIQVKQTQMSQEQFDGLIAKLKITGAQYNLVDYNTIGVINEEKLSIYTMQQKIDKKEK
jgi:hypothetical protein